VAATTARRIVRRVKIVATLGPASADPAMVRRLATAGADCFRLNTAHLRPDQIPALVALVHEAEPDAGRPLGVFCDLAGPKLRVAAVAAAAVEDGSSVTLGGRGATIEIEGVDLARECLPGTRILIHDGKVVLRATGSDAGRVTARVERGGKVGEAMGVNLPDVETSLPSLTDHDLGFLRAALTGGADAISLSFVRSSADVEALRRAMAADGGDLPVIAKLEKAQAVAPEALAAILATADLVMVARGDLGAETAPELVPVLQKEVLSVARSAGVPAITATEMLESMVHEPRPTRAEAADVANAVFDGTDAVMLSAETAVGEHPLAAVEVMARIIAEAEAHPEYRAPSALPACAPESVDPVSDAVAAAAAVAADQLGAAALVCFSQSGKTARLVARHRPARPILALTPSAAVARRLSLVWGVEARVVAEQPDDHEAVVHLAERAAVQEGMASAGELIVVTHGAPLASRPVTNLMRVHRIGS
jgi:pyruvate kinase